MQACLWVWFCRLSARNCQQARARREKARLAGLELHLLQKGVPARAAGPCRAQLKPQVHPARGKAASLAVRLACMSWMSSLCRPSQPTCRQLTIASHSAVKQLPAACGPWGRDAQT